MREGVDRHLINPFRQPFAPFPAVLFEHFTHGLLLHGMTTVMAVTNAVRTFDRLEAHELAAEILFA